MEFSEITKQIKDFSNQEGKYKRLFFSNALAGEVGEYCNIIKKIHREKIFNSILFFSNALAGEVGEYCNIIKKIHREKIFNSTILTEIENELVDIFIYLVLNAKQYYIDLEVAIRNKLIIIEKGLTK